MPKTDKETLNKIPVLGKYISGAVSVNNKILWDVLHNNFKLFTFNTKIAELEKAGKVTKEQERAESIWRSSPRSLSTPSCSRA